MTNSRRKFLLKSGGLMALSSMSLSLQARSHLESLTSHSQKPGLVVYRTNDDNSTAFAEVMVAAGMQSIALAEDPVKQWRDILQAKIVDSNLPVLGLTNWSDFQLMRGLSNELRRHPKWLQEQKPALSDQSEWAVEQALATLDKLQTVSSNSPYFLELNADKPAHQRSLFNWVIL